MKKGFTLIELLAVIVILAIIALIAIPTISGLIEKARLGAVRDSVYNMIDAAELHYAMNDSDSVNGSLTFTCDGSKCTTSSGQVLKFKGKVPIVGEISASKDNSNVFNLTIGNYCAIGSKNDLTVVKGDCAGLYDSNNKRIATWDELVDKYHVSVEEDFDFYDNATTDAVGTKPAGYWSPVSQYEKNGYESLDYVLLTEPKFENVTRIILPNGIKKIGDYALFALGARSVDGCGGAENSYITDIIIPNSVQSIGKLALANDNGLRNLIIPNSVTSIGDYAFRNCFSLEKIVIPNSVKTIGEEIFHNVTTPSYAYKNRKKTDGVKELFLGVNPSLVINSTFTHNAPIEKVVLMDGVTEVPKNYFASVKSLKYLAISNTVKKIGDSAFVGTSIKKISVPSSITELGGGALASNELEELYVDNDIMVSGYIQSYIGSADKLKKVEIGSSVKKIGDYAFQGTHVEDLKIGDNVESIGKSAFFATPIENLVIDDKVKTIGDSAFYANQKLKEVKIGKNVESIGKEVFANCINLKKITLSKKLTSIGAQAFYNTNLESITIPSSVTYIGSLAFAPYKNATSFKSIDFEQSNGWKGYLDNNETVVDLDLSNSSENAKKLAGGMYTPYTLKRN